MLLALPFEGFAATVAHPCDSIPAPAAQAHQAMLPVQHDHASMHHAMASDGAGHHADHGDAAKCGCCPACVGGPALAPASLAAVGLQVVPSVAIPFDPGHLPSFRPSLPERPPRTLLA